MAEFNTGFDPSYFSQLAEVEAKNFWFRARNRLLLLWALRTYFPHAKNFLQIGCETGFVLSGIEKAFPSIILYGAEIFSSGLSYASERLSRVDLFQMDACGIPFDNEFDTIGSFDVLDLNSFDFPPYNLKSTAVVSFSKSLNPIISSVFSEIPVKFRCHILN